MPLVLKMRPRPCRKVFEDFRALSNAPALRGLRGWHHRDRNCGRRNEGWVITRQGALDGNHIRPGLGCPRGRHSLRLKGDAERVAGSEKQILIRNKGAGRHVRVPIQRDVVRGRIGKSDRRRTDRRGYIRRIIFECGNLRRRACGS